MTRPRRTGRLGVAAAVTALMMAVSACTADNGGDEPAPSEQSTSTSAVTSGAPVGNEPFGDCPNLPDSGDGSLLDLSDRDWIDALAALPALSQLTVTVALAGLAHDFSTLPEATVFAPTDTAFRALGVEQGRELLTDPAKGADVLRYHVVAGRIAPDALPGEHRTLNGQPLEITGSGESFTVNGEATILCGNLQTKNATLYLIDRVLQPS